MCRSYDAIQSVYADILQQDENILKSDVMFCWMAYPKETTHRILYALGKTVSGWLGSAYLESF